MKQILFLAFILTVFPALSQDNTTNSTTSFKKIAIGATVSPDFCFRTLKNTDGTEMSNASFDSRNKNEIPKLGFTSGISFIYFIKENLGFECGLQYQNQGFQTNPIGQSVVLPNDPIIIIYRYNYNYANVPLKVNFSIGKKRLKLCTSAGFAINFFTNASITTIKQAQDFSYTQTSSNDNSNYKKINLSPMASIGLDIKLGKRMNLKIEPTFRYGIFKIIDSPVTEYLWNAGLNIEYFVAF